MSVGIPDKIEANDVIAWPTPETVESAELVSSLQATSVALGDKVRALAAYGRELEDAVAARTAELKATGERLALKLLAQWPRLRVLYVSGHVSNRIPGGLSTDMDYLQKPFSRSTLLKRVRAALDRRTGS